MVGIYQYYDIFYYVSHFIKFYQLIVEAWRVVHEDELRAAWYAYNNDGEIVKIKGLE